MAPCNAQSAMAGGHLRGVAVIRGPMQWKTLPNYAPQSCQNMSRAAGGRLPLPLTSVAAGIAAAVR